MEPSATYLRAKRGLVFIAGLLLLSLLVGVIKTAGNGGIFPYELSRPQALSYVLAVIVLYSLIQTVIYWSAQNQEIKGHFSHLTDYVLSLSIGVFSLLLAIGTIFDPLYEVQNALTWSTGSFVTIAMASIVLSLLLILPANLLKRIRTQNTSRSEAEITKLLTAKNWLLIFNPENDNGRKDISFAPDGQIDIGKNQNESFWRVRGQFLEILNSKNEVHSRFSYDPTAQVFRHTNDDDTLSLRNQRIVMKLTA